MRCQHCYTDCTPFGDVDHVCELDALPGKRWCSRHQAEEDAEKLSGELSASRKKINELRRDIIENTKLFIGAISAQLRTEPGVPPILDRAAHAKLEKLIKSLGRLESKHEKTSNEWDRLNKIAHSKD